LPPARARPRQGVRPHDAGVLRPGGNRCLAVGVSRALGLDQSRTANAIAVCGTAFNALRVTRTGTLSHWKGLAYPNTAFGCTHATFLAMRGITGPLEVFEGNKGFMEAIAHLEVISVADLTRLLRRSEHGSDRGQQ
jgi:2-methylcitrate dehydratase PrpD